MSGRPDFRRVSGGTLALWGGAVFSVLLVSGLAGGALDLGLGSTPQVRIDAPTP